MAVFYRVVTRESSKREKRRWDVYYEQVHRLGGEGGFWKVFLFRERVKEKHLVVFVML